MNRDGRPPKDEVRQHMEEILRSHVNPDRDKLNAILAAYDRALEDARTMIPTYLHAAIEAARK